MTSYLPDDKKHAISFVRDCDQGTHVPVIEKNTLGSAVQGFTDRSLTPTHATHNNLLLFHHSLAGVPENLREVAKNSQPSLEISNAGDSWTLKTVVGDKVKDTTFSLGQEFDSKSLTGQDLKVGNGFQKR